ncbi:hypothetical protein K4K58_009192 [Colletotrichum sp. SAR11_239]|nr:hypothetical protein K4K58_009192 [Colletotrichum sp. SAR11_239]
MDEYHTKHIPWFQASVEAFAAKAAKEDLARPDDPNTTPNPDMIVAARLRPMLEDEISAGLIRGVFTRDNTDGAVDIHQIRKHIKPLGPPTLITTSVALDRAYGPEDTSEKIYQDLVEPLVPWAWSGGVSTMFAYGQTGSGKTFTVSAIEKLVAQSLMQGNLDGERKVYACIIELAGNRAFDLLNSRKPISVLEDSFGVTQLAGAQEFEVTEASTLLDLIEKAATYRRTAATEKNDASSRSHAICRMRIENPAMPAAEDGLLYLIDLAGSEAARDRANHTADRMKEAREINTSLSVLKDCIRGRATVDAASLTGKPKKPTHIPFRQSSLTKILKHVFDPTSRRSCKTVVMACVNPCLPDCPAGKNTLKYAEMLRVLLPKAKPWPYDSDVPFTWNNNQLKKWIGENSGAPAISSDLLAPSETGAQLLRLPTPEFLTRCLKTPEVTPDQARAFQAKFWRLHIDSQKSSAKKVDTAGEEAPQTKAEETISRNQKLASSADLDPSAAKLPFKERIRPGMVVRWNPTAGFSGTLPGLNMVVILCPQLAAGSNARDLDGNQVNGEISDGQESNGTKYLCAMVLPGFMADSYEISMWRQVVVDVEQMEAEVLLESILTKDSINPIYGCPVVDPSRAYAVQVTGARGFEAEAAAAELSRVIARRYYDEPLSRIYGYIYGGSGGSFQVIGAMERSRGIWDGAVPFVQAVPISAPNNPSIRAMAGLVLREKAGDIQKALKPGGSGDVLAILNSVEKDVLIEVTKLGIPLSTFEDFAAATDASTLALLTNPIVNLLDPTYANDFWSRKGYLGTELSPLGDIFRRARVSFEATVRHVTVDLAGVPIKIHLQTVPPPAANLDEYWYDFTVYSSRNAILGTLTGTFNAITKVATFDFKRVGQNDLSLLKCLSRGTMLNIDNSRSLAMRAYYRYQVPERPGFYGFDHLRGSRRSSIYPRRTLDVSARLAEGASDSTHDGDIKGKIIVVQNLADSDAFPWHADWYRRQVKQALGDQFDKNYRLWFNENSDHDYEGPKDSRKSLVVPYRGMVQQALRDLSAWVEKGVQPPNPTSHNVGEDNSIQIPSAAHERGGIQPTVSLTVEGKQKSEARVGQVVNFQATVEVPPGAGKVVFVEWDFFGKGRFTYGHLGVPSSKVHVKKH